MDVLRHWKKSTVLSGSDPATGSFESDFEERLPGLPYIHFLQRISTLSLVFALLVGGVVLTGWLVGRPILPRLYPGAPAMPVTSALDTLLSCIALFTLVTSGGRRWRVWLARVLALAVLLMSVLALTGFWRLSVEGASIPPGSAFNYLLCAVALLLLSAPSVRSDLIGQWLALAAMIFFLNDAYGIALKGIDETLALPWFQGSTLHGAVAGVALSVAIFLAHPVNGPASLLASPGLAGGMMRGGLPLAIVLPLLVGVARFEGERHGLYSPAYGVSLMTVTIVLLFSAILWISARIIERQESQLRRAEQRAREQTIQLKEAQALAGIGNWELDLRDNKLTWSDEIYRLFEIDPRRFQATYEAFLEAIHPDDREAVNRAYTESVAGRSAYAIDHRLLMKDGRVKHVHERGHTFYDSDGTPVRSVGTIQDITTRKQAEARLQQINRSLRLILAVNESVLRTDSPEPLLQTACDICVDVGGYRLAWIGRAEQTADKAVTVVAAAGPGEDKIRALNVSWADVERGRGPTGRAVREGKTQIDSEIGTDPSMKPWREAAAREGYGSSAAIPIVIDGAVYGALNVYSEREQDFEAESVRLLEQLANDIGYALGNLEARAALELSEIRYRSLVTATAQIVWSTDAGIRVREDQPGWRAYTGQSEEEIQGLGWMDAVHPDDVASVTALIDRAAAEPKVYDTEYRLRRHDGEYRWLSVRGAPLLSEDGSIREWIGTCTDIHDRRVAEQELRELNATLEQQVDERTRALKHARDSLRERLDELEVVYQNAPIGLAYLDRDLRYVHVNQKLAELNGIPAKAYVGRKPRELLPSLADQVEPQLQRVMETRQPVLHVEVSGTLPVSEGKTFIRDESWAPVLDADGEITGITAVVEDVTEARARESQLRDINQTLMRRTAEVQSANRDLENFAYSVSHDLRAPLRSIDGFSNLLLEDYGPRLDDEGRRLIGIVRDSALKLNHLIEDILQFSRAGRRELQYELVDVSALVHEVYGELARDIGTRTVELNCATLPAAWADPTGLRQVFVNLLSNALKFTADRQPAVIDITAQVSEDKMVYTVKDNGAGFDPQYAHKLFGVFQRLHGDEFQGTGIGLAIVRRVIEKHGGRVWAEGAPDVGATFHFTLPDVAGVEQVGNPG